MSAILVPAANHSTPDVAETKRLEAVWQNLPLDASLGFSMQRSTRIATHVLAAPMGSVPDLRVSDRF